MNIKKIVEQNIRQDASNGVSKNRVLSLPPNYPGKVDKGDIHKLPAYYKTIAEYEISFKEEYNKMLKNFLIDVNKIIKGE